MLSRRIVEIRVISEAHTGAFNTKVNIALKEGFEKVSAIEVINGKHTVTMEKYDNKPNRVTQSGQFCI